MSKNQLSPKLWAASRATLRSKALPGSSFSGLNQAFQNGVSMLFAKCRARYQAASADPFSKETFARARCVLLFWPRQSATGPDWARTSDPALIKRML